VFIHFCALIRLNGPFLHLIFCLTIPLLSNKKNRPVENPLGRLGANEQNYR
jgi:hypothetical protein